jgi:hypothetical protein
VWRRAGSGWEGDFEADDAFVRCVGELVLVHELKCWEWRAWEEMLGLWMGMRSGRRTLLDVVDWLFHLSNLGVDHCED